jgi:hypothetical protein
VTESADGLGETTQGLADTAGDQVAAATDLGLPVDGVLDPVIQAADNLGETGRNVADTATGSLSEGIDPGQKR